MSVFKISFTINDSYEIKVIYLNDVWTIHSFQENKNKPNNLFNDKLKFHVELKKTSAIYVKINIAPKINSYMHLNAKKFKD